MGLVLKERAKARAPRSRTGIETWVDREVAGCEFKDERLGRRFGKLLAQIGSDMGQSIPLVCQDWANTKAAYRFLSNERVNEADILCGHFEATRGRVTTTEGPILVLHDTTEFSFKRNRPELIGFTGLTGLGTHRGGPTAVRTQCGILMHSSLAVTTEGLPIGLTAIKFWTRKKFKGTTALKRKINPTRVPIEQKESIRWLENLRQSTDLLAAPGRCVHIGDRESDIYELFCLAEEVGTHFLVRTCVDRLAGDGNHTIADEMDEVTVKGLHRIEVKDDKGDPDEALLEIRFRKLRILPPIGKQKKYPALTLTVIHAQERGTPKRRKKIEWKLLTDLPVQSRKDAIEKLGWYALRWKIEVFHKILKSGCKAEEDKQMTAERIFVQHLLHLERQRRKASAHVRVACREPHSRARRNRDHRRTKASRTRRSASPSTSPSTRMRCPLPRSISMMPWLLRRRAVVVNGASATSRGGADGPISTGTNGAMLASPCLQSSLRHLNSSLT
ncbi:IS4 family transposase (plasmid) [Bradyrhizobium sp. CCGUVB1N3]|nr:IS4 family transposase [Bradyrhizobium sp. CCGUVB1N3]MCP3477825.1 IS4 family transposase [Bradyrhizobium sp. CCGUVB1N3]